MKISALCIIAMFSLLSPLSHAEPLLLSKQEAALILAKDKVLLKMGVPVLPVLLTKQDILSLSDFSPTSVHTLLSSHAILTSKMGDRVWTLTSINNVPCLQSDQAFLLLLSKPIDKWTTRSITSTVSDRMLLLSDTVSGDVLAGIQLP